MLQIVKKGKSSAKKNKRMCSSSRLEFRAHQGESCMWIIVDSLCPSHMLLLTIGHPLNLEYLAPNRFTNLWLSSSPIGHTQTFSKEKLSPEKTVFLKKIHPACLLLKFDLNRNYRHCCRYQSASSSRSSIGMLPQSYYSRSAVNWWIQAAPLVWKKTQLVVKVHKEGGFNHPKIDDSQQLGCSIKWEWRVSTLRECFVGEHQTWKCTIITWSAGFFFSRCCWLICF